MVYGQFKFLAPLVVIVALVLYAGGRAIVDIYNYWRMGEAWRKIAFYKLWRVIVSLLLLMLFAGMNMSLGIDIIGILTIVAVVTFLGGGYLEYYVIEHLLPPGERIVDRDYRGFLARTNGHGLKGSRWMLTMYAFLAGIIALFIWVGLESGSF